MIKEFNVDIPGIKKPGSPLAKPSADVEEFLRSAAKTAEIEVEHSPDDSMETRIKAATTRYLALYKYVQRHGKPDSVRVIRRRDRVFLMKVDE